MSQEKYDSLLKECREKIVENPESAKEILLNLSVDNQDERKFCQDLWMDLLDDRTNKKILMGWQSDKKFGDHIRDIFCR